MVDFSKLYIMLIKHQPLEAYFCLLYPSEHGSPGDRAGGRTWVRITIFFSGEYGGIDLGRHHHNLVRAHNLIYSCTCHGLL